MHRTASIHLAAAIRRLTTAIQALRDRGATPPSESLALLSDLETAATDLQTTRADIAVAIVPADGKGPDGKEADAELCFLTGPLQGLKLIGFAVWSRRTGSGFNVTFPARSYAINGERRSFALLRPSGQTTHDAQETARRLILDGWQRYQDTDERRSEYDQDGRRVTAPHPHSPQAPQPPAPPAPPATPTLSTTPTTTPAATTPAAHEILQSIAADLAKGQTPSLAGWTSVDTTTDTTSDDDLGRRPAPAPEPAHEPAPAPAPAPEPPPPAIVTTPGDARLSTRDAEAQAATIASEIWPTFTANEQGMIKYGIFPAGKTQAADARLNHPEAARLMAVALMNEASRHAPPPAPVATRSTTRRAKRF